MKLTVKFKIRTPPTYFDAKAPSLGSVNVTNWWLHFSFLQWIADCNFDPVAGNVVWQILSLISAPTDSCGDRSCKRAYEKCPHPVQFITIILLRTWKGVKIFRFPLTYTDIMFLLTKTHSNISNHLETRDSCRKYLNIISYRTDETLPARNKV
jgi:hypothetical protein